MGGPEHWFCDFVYTYVVCKLHFSIKQATNIVATFWIVFTLTRVFGVYVADKFKPRTIYFFNAIVTTATFFILYLISSSNSNFMDLAIWLATIVLAISYATCFAAGISWIAEFIPVTGLYACFPGIGNYVGQMLPALATGILHRDPTMWFFYGGVYASGMLLFSIILQTFGTRLRASLK